MIRFPTAVLLACLAATSAQARDNFLVIVADDLGVDGVGVYAEGIDPAPTPTIDQLAAEGVLFRNAYTNPMCAPTRAQAMTGRHALRTGIGVPGGANLALSETTIPEMLGVAYRTAAIGKWHLGGNDVDHPIDSGFEYYAGPLTNINDYESWNKTTNSTTTTGSTQAGYATYVTTDNADEAIAKIAEFDEDPWFVWLAFTAPHSPFHVPPASLTTITVGAGSDNTTKFKAAVEAMDTEIARVLASIPQDVLDDTTIIFMGDNGTPGMVSESPFESNHAKGTVYDGGVNVPLIVTSPLIDPADEGSESAALVTSTDLFATLAQIVDTPAVAEDSVSLVPYLENPSLPTLPARPYAYAERFEPNGGPYTDYRKAIRGETYKLVWRNGVYEEFFDLTANPFEDANLLPVSGLTPEQTAAYDALVAAMENVDASGDAACPAVPDAACLDFAKAGLVWKQSGEILDKLTAKLLTGPALSQADLGNPLSPGGTAYTLCVYDDAGSLIVQPDVHRAGEECTPGKVCWKTIGNDPPEGKGYKYKDLETASDGIKKVVFKAGDSGKPKIKLKGKGTQLPDGVPAALATTASVTMQLRGSDAAQCASATLSEIVRQDADLFKAK